MLPRIDYIWRVVATGFCFAVFGLGGMLLGLLVFPLVAALPGSRDRSELRTRRLIGQCFRLFLGLARLLGVGKVTVRNAELLGSARGVLVLANHPTLLDVVVLISCLPEADCVVKEALWRNPFLRSVVKGAGYVSNASPTGMLEECGARLRKGRALLIFPEGTRSVPGEAMRLQRGAARLLLRQPVPVLPVTMRCDPPTLMKDVPWYKVPPRPWHIQVMVHPPVELLPEPSATEPESVAVRQLTKELRITFERKLAEHENAYRRTA